MNKKNISGKALSIDEFLALCAGAISGWLVGLSVVFSVLFGLIIVVAYRWWKKNKNKDEKE